MVSEAPAANRRLLETGDARAYLAKPTILVRYPNWKRSSAQNAVVESSNLSLTTNAAEVAPVARRPRTAKDSVRLRAAALC